MAHICVSTTYQHRLRQCLVASSVPSHHLNQCCHIVNYTLRTLFRWIFTYNSKVFSYENALDNVVCEMAAISSRPQLVHSIIVVISSIINTDRWPGRCHKISKPQENYRRTYGILQGNILRPIQNTFADYICKYISIEEKFELQLILQGFFPSPGGRREHWWS